MLHRHCDCAFPMSSIFPARRPPALHAPTPVVRAAAAQHAAGQALWTGPINTGASLTGNCRTVSLNSTKDCIMLVMRSLCHSPLFRGLLLVMRCLCHSPVFRGYCCTPRLLFELGRSVHLRAQCQGDRAWLAFSARLTAERAGKWTHCVLRRACTSPR